MKHTSSKGTINLSIRSIIDIRKSAPFDNFEVENVLSDLSLAATNANFKDSNDNIMTFKFLEMTNENSYGNLIKIMSIQMINFPAVHFTMALPTASEEDQKKFRSWNKFWTELTKIGYKVK
jgi:hypothetical protein